MAIRCGGEELRGQSRTLLRARHIENGAGAPQGEERLVSSKGAEKMWGKKDFFLSLAFSVVFTVTGLWSEKLLPAGHTTGTLFNGLLFISRIAAVAFSLFAAYLALHLLGFGGYRLLLPAAGAVIGGCYGGIVLRVYLGGAIGILFGGFAGAFVAALADYLRRSDKRWSNRCFGEPNCVNAGFFLCFSLVLLVVGSMFVPTDLWPFAIASAIVGVISVGVGFRLFRRVARRLRHIRDFEQTFESLPFPPSRLADAARWKFGVQGKVDATMASLAEIFHQRCAIEDTVRIKATEEITHDEFNEIEIENHEIAVATAALAVAVEKKRFWNAHGLAVYFGFRVKKNSVDYANDPRAKATRKTAAIGDTAK